MGSKRLGGIRSLGNGVPNSGSMIVVENCPARCASVGNVLSVVVDSRMYAASKSPNTNVLFLIAGPPAEAPNWFRLYGGLYVANRFFASTTSLRMNSKALPCSWFEPDLMATLTTPEEDRPYSAE